MVEAGDTIHKGSDLANYTVINPFGSSERLCMQLAPPKLNTNVSGLKINAGEQL